MSTNAFVNVEPPNWVGVGAQFTGNPVPAFASQTWGGHLAMSGVTKDAGGTPHSRRVYLLLYPAMKVLGYQQSDGSGAFAFDNLRLAAAGTRYLLLAVDTSAAYNAAARDNLTPV